MLKERLMNSCLHDIVLINVANQLKMTMLRQDKKHISRELLHSCEAAANTLINVVKDTGS